MTRSRQRATIDKGCSSKVFFKNLHASRQKESITRVKKCDGQWTHSLSELLNIASQHFTALFAQPPATSPDTFNDHYALLHHV